MAQIKIRIESLFPKDGDILEMKTMNRITGKTKFLGDNGILYEREPLNTDVVSKMSMNMIESFTFQGDQRKRCFGYIDFLTEKDEIEIKNEELRRHNELKKSMYDFLQVHESVVVPDSNGKNLNKNIGILHQYRLIDETKQINDYIASEKIKTSSRNIVDNLYEKDIDGFIDLCYACNVRAVAATTKQRLYKELMMKINTNPDAFDEVYTKKYNNDIFIAVKKAQDFLTGDLKYLIDFKNNMWHLDDEAIAANEDEMVSYFQINPKKREYLYSRLGIKRDMVLPKEPEAAKITIPKDDIEQIADSFKDTQRIEEMKFDMRKSLKMPSEKKRDTFLTELRKLYKDLENEFDDYKLTILKTKI